MRRSGGHRHEGTADCGDGSHIDLCLGASKYALAEEDGVDLDALLTSAAVGTRHILATALAASTDILLWRRDTALASSSLLPGPSMEAMRAAPLASATLLGGLCEKASKDDMAERQRLLLTRQTGFGSSSSASHKKKSSKPRSASRGKPRPPQSRPQYREEPRQEPAFRPPQPPPAPYPPRGRGSGRGRARGFGVSSRRPRRGGR